MSSSINNLYEFGEFRFDGANKILWHGDRMIALPPKATEVLFMLLEAEGKLVAKKDLLNTVWADTFVEEGVLTQSVYQLRQALGAEEPSTQFIENIARRGYRLAVPVKKIRASETPAAVAARPQTDLFNGGFASETANGTLNPETNPAEAGLFEPAAELPRSFHSPPKVEAAVKPAISKVNLFLVALTAVAAVAAIGYTVFYFSFRTSENSRRPVAPIEQLKFQRLTDFGNVIFPTISPDGQFLAFIRHEDQQESVWIKQIEADGAIQILPPSRAGYRSPVFSPDGKYLFYREVADGGGIYQVPVLGGTPKKVAENVWSDFGISNDGRRFAFIRRDPAKNSFQLIVSNYEDGAERVLRERTSPQDYRGTVTWSPDGRRVAVVGGLRRQNYPKLFTVDVETGEETELKTPRWRAISHALWLPSGQMIVSAREAEEPNSQIWMLDTENGETRRLTNDLESYFWLSLSADGTRLIARQQRIVSHLWLVPDGDLKRERQLTSGVRNFDGYVGLAWTPDDRIIYSVRMGSTTNLFSINRDGGDPIQLTENAGEDNTDPVVSADGRYIVFTSNRTGQQQIWRMDTDGRNQTQLTFGENEQEIAHSADISPDGKDVYYIRGGAGGASIWKVPIEGGPAVKISDHAPAGTGYFISISPDGKLIAYHQTSDKPENPGDEPTIRIGLLSSDGQMQKGAFDLPMRRTLVRWSGNTTFDYFAGTYNTSTLMRLNIVDGTTRKLLEFPERVHNFAWSKDGENLIVSRGKLQGDAILITNLPR
jgi:Tol biopolymer transport system component/DNA-binding winged helix-turn-helix (wHTH) protein